MPNTFFVDFSTGSDSNDGSSYANRCKTLAHLTTAAAGDTIRVAGSGIPTYVGGALWTEGSKFVVFSDSASDLTVNHLISKNTGVGETWYAIKSISDPTITLDSSPSSGTAFPGYPGDTETVPTYSILTTVVSGLATAQTFSRSGTSGSPISIVGGYNASSMETITDVTWMDGKTGTNTGFSITGSYIYLDRLAATRYGTGWALNSSNHITGNIYGANNCGTSGIVFSTSTSVLELTNIYSCTGNVSNGLSIAGAGAIICDNIVCHSNLVVGATLSAKYIDIGSFKGYYNVSNIQVTGPTTTTSKLRIKNIEAGNSSTSYGVDLENRGELFIDSLITTDNKYGVYLNSFAPIRIYHLESSGNTTYGVYYNPQSNHVDYIYDSYITDATPFYFNIESTGLNDRYIYFQNRDGTLNDNYTYTPGARIEVVNPDAETTSGISYKLSITGTYRTTYMPVIYKFPAIVFNSGDDATLTAQIKRSSADINGKLLLLKGEVPGATDDISTTITGVGSYVTHTLNFTPTANGAAYIYLWFWGDGVSTSDYINIADLTLTAV